MRLWPNEWATKSQYGGVGRRPLGRDARFFEESVSDEQVDLVFVLLPLGAGVGGGVVDRPPVRAGVGSSDPAVAARSLNQSDGKIS